MLKTPTAPEKTKIAVKDLNFYYGKFHALKSINMEIPQNKVTAFIGPSGCGKSTLLRVFNRMFELYPEQRAEGQILLDGQNLLTSKEDVALLRAKVGMVFQKPTPFPMSIFDNIAFGVKLFESLNASDMEERVEWALRKSALWTEVKDKLHQSGSSLSGGQQQQLAIARALAARPKLLILDEPTEGIQPSIIKDIGRVIRRLADEGLNGQRMAVILVEQYYDFAAELADQYLVMERGEVIARGRGADMEADQVRDRVAI